MESENSAKASLTLAPTSGESYDNPLFRPNALLLYL